MNAQALEITDNAANKVRQLRDSEGNQDLMLRVYVTGGGCSGFSYGFNFAESMNEDDAEFMNGDVKTMTDDEFASILKLFGKEPDDFGFDLSVDSADVDELDELFEDGGVDES